MAFGEKYASLWGDLDPSQDEHAKIFLNELMDNRKETNRRWIRGNYVFISLATIFALLSWGSTQEVQFFSIKISDIWFIELALPTILAFINYQCTCAIFFAEQLRELIDAYMKINLKPVWDRNLELTMDSPTFFNIERFISRGDFVGAKVAENFATVVILALLILPLLVCVIFSYINFSLSVNIAWKIVFMILTMTFVVRSVFIIFALFHKDRKIA